MLLDPEKKPYETMWNITV
uniref:Uncharacterized protein n=1 Tax=Anguilla anguilla TaxID=7936 RepID=A0A0E9T454_ANGAN